MADSTTSVTNVTKQINGFTDGFSKFVSEQNIIGLAIGIILAQSSLELSKSIGTHFIKPVVRVMTNKDKSLQIDMEEIFSDVLVLGLTLMIIYVLITLLGIKPSSTGINYPLHLN